MSTPEEMQFTRQLAEFNRTHRFGKYRGLVTAIDDPETIGRIKANVPEVLGELESPWAMPAFPFAGPQHGFVLLPEVGDGVWIEFEAGDISRPIWSGCWFARGQRPSPDTETARLFATSAGHQILIDEQNDTISLEHPGGAKLTLAASDLTLEMGNCSIKITSTEVNINNGMVKVTTAGASLVNDAFKVGG